MHVPSLVAISADGIPIQYDVQGQGAVALVFVHSWCCNRHYWDQQIEHFSPHYIVVRLDLAGHGTSGQDRAQWTMAAFGQDVVAVVEHLKLTHVVLIGHAMSGGVIVEAARRLPNKIIGLVGVDTWPNVEEIRTPEQIAASMEPFRANFVEATRAFVLPRFGPAADPTLVEHIVRGMSAAPPHIGIDALAANQRHSSDLRAGLQEVSVPKIAINARPTDVEVAQRYGIAVLRMSGVGHFGMLEDPASFNRLLDEAVQQCMQARQPE